MIMIYDQKVKRLNQKIYDDMIAKIDLSLIRCPLCNNIGFNIHGYYERKVICEERSFNLVVCRIICSACHKTHAILTSHLIPYKRISLRICLMIIKTKGMKTILDKFPLSQELLPRLKRDYRRYWRARLKSIQIKLDDRELAFKCLFNFHRQFMQIRSRSAFLFS